MIYCFINKISTKSDTWSSRDDFANFNHFMDFSVFFDTVQILKDEISKLASVILTIKTRLMLYICYGQYEKLCTFL